MSNFPHEGPLADLDDDVYNDSRVDHRMKYKFKYIKEYDIFSIVAEDAGDWPYLDLDEKQLHELIASVNEALFAKASSKDSK